MWREVTQRPRVAVADRVCSPIPKGSQQGYRDVVPREWYYDLRFTIYCGAYTETAQKHDLNPKKSVAGLLLCDFHYSIPPPNQLSSRRVQVRSQATAQCSEHQHRHAASC